MQNKDNRHLKAVATAKAALREKKLLFFNLEFDWNGTTIQVEVLKKKNSELFFATACFRGLVLFSSKTKQNFELVSKKILLICIPFRPRKLNIHEWDQQNIKLWILFWHISFADNLESILLIQHKLRQQKLIDVKNCCKSIFWTNLVFFYFAANILDLTLTLGILYWQLNCLLEIWYLTKFCWSRNFPKNSIFVNVCFERICSRLHFRKRSAYVYKYSGIYWLSIVSLNQLKELTLIRTLIF